MRLVLIRAQMANHATWSRKNGMLPAKVPMASPILSTKVLCSRNCFSSSAIRSIFAWAGPGFRWLLDDMRRSRFRVGNVLASKHSERRQRMRLSSMLAENVLHLDAAGHQRVRDQRTMTTPGNRFRAHDRRRRLTGEAKQLLQALLELWCLHVIRVASERGVAPSGVSRIRAGAAQPSQSRYCLVCNAGFPEAYREQFLVELWITPRPGYASDVHNLSNSVSLKQADEFVYGTR